MCGLVGIFERSAKREIEPAMLTRMTDSLAHRGPDDSGMFIGDGIGLGHRRLSIIDLDGGKQPVRNERGTVTVVYNGEIYNYPFLARELQNLGHQFSSKSDTEVIVHAWEEWGPKCVEWFRGMFAFALWDEDRQMLFLARDRLGIKPLYYSVVADERILFASELKALMLHPEVSRRLDPCAVEEYFAYGYVPEPRSIFSGIEKLPPGYTAVASRNEFRLRLCQYWDVPMHPDAVPAAALNEEDVAAELADRLSEAIRLRLRSDVPLGAFLSGGVDSSSVVSLMSRQLPSRIRTFSIGFHDDAFDESKHAERIARRYNCRHHSALLDGQNSGLLHQVASLYDEPFADSSALPTFLLCGHTRKDVTVALSGDGGDELFAGYRGYGLHLRKERIRNALPASLRRPLFSSLAAVYPKADWAPRFLRAKRTFETLAGDSLESFAVGAMLCTTAERRRLYSETLLRDLQGYDAVEVLRGHYRNAPTTDVLGRVQYVDMKAYLPGDILTKVDRASMAHGLEVRVPLLDHPFVEWVSRLPSSFKLRGDESKAIFKRAMRPYLDGETLSRKKMGFSIPLANWLRGPLRPAIEALPRGSHLVETGLFSPRQISAVVRQHVLGVRNWSSVLWALLVFDSFVDRSLATSEERSSADAAVARKVA